MPRSARTRAEERVNTAIEMSDVVAQIAADAVRDQHPDATEEEIRAPVRRRIWQGR
jgi:hypothetical protein